MALNPPLDANANPYRVANEHFILFRKGCEFELNIENMGKLKGKGGMSLTSLRLVLINERGGELSAFDLPHGNTFKEKFQQPFFGSNYWEGQCLPLMNSLPGKVSFKIWFTEGGCSGFNRVYRQTLIHIRSNKSSQELAKDVQSSAFKQQFALIDPSDPSTIYVQQPAMMPTPQAQPAAAASNQGVIQHPGGVQIGGSAPPMMQQPMQQSMQQPMQQPMMQQQPMMGQPMMQQQPQMMGQPMQPQMMGQPMMNQQQVHPEQMMGQPQPGMMMAPQGQPVVIGQPVPQQAQQQPGSIQYGAPQNF